jgi:pyridoxine/pyridoxamine 5'-phosphate oxidase
VATVDREGHPQARTLVLREVDTTLAVFCNRTSPKWAELTQGPSVAVVVWLPTLNLQYRLRCAISPVPDHVVAASWTLRPPVPKRLDWLYTRHLPQGSAVDDRASLLTALAAVTLPEPLIAPETAAGLFLHPERIDRLDLAQPDGVHDRRHFERHEDGWRDTVRVP